MATIKYFILLLLLSVVTFAVFNVSPYIYPNETAASISQINFTYNATSYSLVQIGASDTFLLKNGNLVLNQSEVQSVVNAYYLQQYYPSPSEIANLSDLVSKFNLSRNAGGNTTFAPAGEGEYYCRNNLLHSNGQLTVMGAPLVCSDNTTCMEVASEIVQVWSNELGQYINPSIVYDPLVIFTPTSLALDRLMVNYTQKINDLDPSNLLLTLNYIKANNPTVQSYSQTLQSSLLLSSPPGHYADCPNCLGLCPPLNFNDHAISDLTTLVNTLSLRAAPLQNSQSLTDSVFSRTLDRLSYGDNVSAAKSYFSLLAQSNNSIQITISFANSTVSHVSNSTLSSNLARLVFLNSDIPSKIKTHNFTGLDLELSEYRNLGSQVNNLSTVLSAQYNATVTDMKMANYYVLLLQSKDLDPNSATILNSIENRTLQLDYQFRDGMSEDQLQVMDANFANLSSQSSELLNVENSVPASKSVAVFRSFTKRVNFEIASFAQNSHIVNSQAIESSPKISFGFISLIIFFSFGSIALMLFLYSAVAYRSSLQSIKSVFVSLFVIGLFLTLLFSIFFYLFLSKTANNATLQEFSSDFKNVSSTSIFVDARNASFAESNSMVSCANILSNRISQLNKSSTIYVLQPTVCMVSSSSTPQSTTLSLSNCLDSMANKTSLFTLSNSAGGFVRPQFSVIYQNKVQLYGDNNYYSACPALSMFN